MWLGTRRMSCDVADAHPSAAVIESLETRRLLTDATDGMTWEFVDDNGVSQGTAILQDGVLKVTATDGNDEMTIGTHAEPGRFYVMINRAGISLDVADVRGVEIDAGAGTAA